MKKTILIAVLITMTIIIYFGAFNEANTIPSYARQTGKSCLACHSMVPHLKFEGRKFKILNYSEVNPEYEFLPDLQILKKIAPFAIRTLFSPLSWENGSGWSVATEYDFSIYGGGRISDKAGIFAQINSSSDMQMVMIHQLKMSYQLASIKKGKAYWGTAFGIGPPTSFDVYMSINPMQRLPAAYPYVFPHGHMPMDMEGMEMAMDSAACGESDHAHSAIPEFFQITNPGNMGITSYLWAKERLWLQAGVFKGVNGNDPDFWGRIAFEPIKTKLAIGGFAYIGKEDVSMDEQMEMMCEEMEGMWSMPMNMDMDMKMKTDVLRIGADFEFEKSFNMNILHVIGAYSYIKDETDVLEMNMVMGSSGMSMETEIKRETNIYHGFYVQAMYLQNAKFGPVAQFDYLDNNMRGIFGLKYYIMPNIGISAEYVLNLDDMDDMRFGLTFDAAF